MQNNLDAAASLKCMNDVPSLIADYELAHDVESYIAFGTNVWPILRNWIGERLTLGRRDLSCVGTGGQRSNARGRWLLNGLAHHVWPAAQLIAWKARIALGISPSPSRRCDVLVFGSGQRYAQLGDHWIHYATAPFVDLLTQEGLECSVWQWGEAPKPVYHNAANVVPPIALRQRLYALRARFQIPREPRWFGEVSSFHRQVLGYPMNWAAVAHSLSLLPQATNLFEEWLRRAKPSLLALDCWTNFPLFAASAAAHRLSIPVLELQHGLQEHTHFAYHKWSKEPRGGWSTLPDVFWVWGERAAALYETNRISQEVIVGGYPWLRRWVLEQDTDTAAACAEARALVAGSPRSVLVTLQGPPAAYEIEYLRTAIGASPSSWLWFVRMHPNTRTEQASAVRTLAAGHTNVLVHQASELPLYAILKAVDVHLTGYSTCTNEALVLGKPTVLHGDHGLNYFRDLVEAGVAIHEPSPEHFAAAANRALAICAASLRRAGEIRLSLDEAAVRRAVARVVEIARDRKAA